MDAITKFDHNETRFTTVGHSGGCSSTRIALVKRFLSDESTGAFCKF